MVYVFFFQVSESKMKILPTIGAEEMPEIFWEKPARAMTAVAADAVMVAISVDD